MNVQKINVQNLQRTKKRAKTLKGHLMHVRARDLVSWQLTDAFKPK